MGGGDDRLSVGLQRALVPASFTDVGVPIDDLIPAVYHQPAVLPIGGDAVYIAPCAQNIGKLIRYPGCHFLLLRIIREFPA